MTPFDGDQTAGDRVLLDYLDSLLHDSVSDASATLDLFPLEAAASGAGGHLDFRGRTNVTSLPTHPRMSRASRVVEPLKLPVADRPFAEPARPLRLTTLLPPVAPVQAPAEVVVAREVAIEAPPIVVSVAPEVITATPSPSAKAPVREAPVIPAPIVPAPIAPAQIVPAPIVPIPSVFAPQILTAEANAEDAERPCFEPSAWAANGRPQWAQQKFECLLFTTGGLKLAVPLVELGSIYPLESDDINRIFGQIDWFLGLIRIKQGNLRVVDTARVVMPERYDTAMPEAYRFVISLSACDWALGADAIGGTVVLDPEQVRWRGERSKRPWLAGTVVEQMCALLDVAQLAHMFDQQDRKRGTE